MKEQIRQLLEEHHPNELARLTGADDKACKIIVHELLLEYAGDPDQWFVEYCGDGQYALFGVDHSSEWIDENGDYRSFDSQAEALAYLKDFFQKHTGATA